MPVSCTLLWLHGTVANLYRYFNWDFCSTKMSGYPYNNPHYPNINVQIYNPSHTAPPTAHVYPGPAAQPYSTAYAPSAAAPTYAYSSYSGQPAAPPVVSNYFLSVTGPPRTEVEWIATTRSAAASLSGRAVVAGHEGHDHSPLWVIRARYQGDLIPGKLAVKHQAAYVPWNGKEHPVADIEVCCARPDTVHWVQSSYGSIPHGAVSAGRTRDGEPLYVGRARYQGSLTPGKVHPSHKSMYMSFGGKEIPHRFYEVLCTV